MTEPDYFKVMESRKAEALETADAKLKASIKARAEELQTAKPLPRDLRRALESGEEGRVEACIEKALSEGWTEEELEISVDLLVANLKNAEQN